MLDLRFTFSILLFGEGRDADVVTDAAYQFTVPKQTNDQRKVGLRSQMEESCPYFIDPSWGRSDNIVNSSVADNPASKHPGRCARPAILQCCITVFGTCRSAVNPSKASEREVR